MKRTIVTMICLIVMGTGFCLGQAASKRHFRYRGETVELGDSKYEVLARIGNPYGKMRRKRQFLQRDNLNSVYVSTVSEEKWLYNFGSRRFYHVLTFENNKLSCIETGDYGYDRSDIENCHSQSLRIEVGDLKPVVEMKCGGATNVDTYTTEKYISLDDYHSERVQIETEEWVYNFGPGQPLTILHFENGELVNIERGPRGY